MVRPAILAIAGHEWRRRRAALLLLGVLAGLFGGVVVAGASLTRRSTTAPARLYAASGLGDAQVRFFRPELLDELRALPMVEDVAISSVVVARLEGRGAVQYVGVTAPGEPRSGLLTPVVIEGRAAHPDDASEVMLIEDTARDAGLRVGDALDLWLLTPEEMFQFDTGFGDPDGPRLALTITGVVRVPPGTFQGTPLLTTPAFAREQQAMFSGSDATFALRNGPGDLAAFSAAVDRIVASVAPAEAGDDFAPAAVTDPAEGTDALEHSSRVLVGGLAVAALAAGVAVLVALGQAWARHQDASAADQQIERSLGLTSLERAAARALPAAGAAAAAGVVAALVGLTGGLLEPPGALGRVEPDPGWRPDVAVVILGAVVVALAVVLTAGATAWHAGRLHAAAGGVRRRGPGLRAMPRRNGWPYAGAVFALAPGARTRRAPMRTSLAAAVLGVAGLVGALTFTASLDRVTDEPARYGWTSDLAVVDATDEILAEVLADDRFAAVADSTSANVSIDGRYLNAYAFRAQRGAIGWTMLEGRAPTAADEVALGTKLAARLDAAVGDVVDVGDPASGAPQPATVVGIGLGAPMNGEAFAVHVLFTGDGLARARSVGNFREVFVRVAPGVDLAAVTAELGARYELAIRSVPPEVRDVADLGSLPIVLGGFLAALAMAALVHGLVVTVRERRADLAVMRALGATTRQLRLSVVTVALVTAVAGVGMGVPLGWALARFVWGRVASSLGVAPDLVVPWTIVPVGIAAFALAALVATPSARHAARHQAGEALRGD